jgi:hypothetical protein
MLRSKARDEGRSSDYDAEERNAADGYFSCKPGWGVAFRAVCFVARFANTQRLFDAARFAHPIPESRRRGAVEYFNTLLMHCPVNLLKSC